MPGPASCSSTASATTSRGSSRPSSCRRRLVVATDYAFAAIPTVTPTAKPAVSPARRRSGPGADFGCTVAATGAAQNANVLRQLVADAGFEVIEGRPPARRPRTLAAGPRPAKSMRSATGFAERLSREVERCLDEIADRVSAPARRRVGVGADRHRPRLAAPAGRPAEGRAAAAPDREARKARCARLNAEAPVDVPVLPWYWDPTSGSPSRLASAASRPGPSTSTAGSARRSASSRSSQSRVPRP